MRLRNGRNKGLSALIILAFISGCATRRISQPLEATYHYTAVLKNGQPLFGISPGDTMRLTASGDFNYVISKAGKNATGHYVVVRQGKKQAFRFTYLPDSSVRTFEICRNTGKTLILCEGPLRFEYRRIR